MSKGEYLEELRPLKRAHGSLPLAFVAAWIVLTTAFQCRQRPEGVLEAFLVCVVMTTLWVNHLAIAPVAGLRGFVRLIASTLLDLFRLCLVWLIVFIPLAIFLPTYQCYNDRSTVASWLAATSEVRSVVDTRIRNSGSTSHAGAGLQMTLGIESVTGSVMDDGQIIVLGNAPAAALVLIPSLADGTVTWTCLGMPEKVVPMECRRERGSAALD